MSSALSQAKALANLNNKAERENVKLQAQYNSQLAQENRDWQEEMSNTAHQREIKDLKAAGLNPVLSVTGGQGATTPSGSAASVSKANTDMSLSGKVMDMAIASMNNANALNMTRMQLENALDIKEMELEFAKWQHETPSGDSYWGQYNSAKEYMLNKAYEAARKLGYNPDNVSVSGFLNMLIDGNIGPYTREYANDLVKKSKNYLGVTKESRDNFRSNEQKYYGFNSFSGERKIAKQLDNLFRANGSNESKRSSHLKQLYRKYSFNNYRYHKTR